MSSPMHRNNHVTIIEIGYKNWRNINLGGDALGSATTGVRYFWYFGFSAWLFLIDWLFYYGDTPGDAVLLLIPYSCHVLLILYIVFCRRSVTADRHIPCLSHPWDWIFLFFLYFFSHEDLRRLSSVHAADYWTTPKANSGSFNSHETTMAVLNITVFLNVRIRIKRSKSYRTNFWTANR